MTGNGFSRRTLMQAAALGSAQLMMKLPRLYASATPGSTVDSRFWLWSHIAGAYAGTSGLVGPSRITPVEAAHFLGIPNVFMVEYNGQPAPSEWKQFSVPFRSLERLSWSVVPPGMDEKSTQAEREAVLDFAFSNPQIASVVMDDFFVRRSTWTKDQVAALTVPELEELKHNLQRNGKRLDLWVVLYAHQVNDPSFHRLAPYLRHCDIVQLWPWWGHEIPSLPETFAKVEALVPGMRKALGCFMWDFGDQKPLPVSAMEQQCGYGLEWLEKGRIEAMVFAASWLCDRDLDAVEWTRKWIRKVGNQKLTP